MSTYRPSPIDTEHVRLPDSLTTLTERLARNTHENWSRLRIQQGWTWGPRRDDDKKEHPNLVPYEELAEADKDYDRRTATEALKTVLALGYTIREP